jgi:hypothetical protein
LLALTCARRHALDFLHAATRRPRPVVEPVDAPADCIQKAAHRAGHDADSVPVG